MSKGTVLFVICLIQICKSRLRVPATEYPTLLQNFDQMMDCTLKDLYPLIRVLVKLRLKLGDHGILERELGILVSNL